MNRNLYVWEVYEHDEWGTIGASVARSGMTPSQAIPLVTRRREIAEQMFRPPALLHQTSTGFPVRLARYEVADVLEGVG